LGDWEWWERRRQEKRSRFQIKIRAMTWTYDLMRFVFGVRGHDPLVFGLQVGAPSVSFGYKGKEQIRFGEEGISIISIRSSVRVDMHGQSSN
jgi:hypothetical protein